MNFFLVTLPKIAPKRAQKGPLGAKMNVFKGRLRGSPRAYLANYFGDDEAGTQNVEVVMCTVVRHLCTTNTRPPFAYIRSP